MRTILLMVAALTAFVIQPARGAAGELMHPATTSSAPQEKILWHCGMHPQVIQDHPGTCPICHMALTPMKVSSTSAGKRERRILYWWDPMLGPSSISDKPGKSAMGMDLVPVYAEEAGPAVEVDPAVVQNMGVRTAEVTVGPLTKTIRAVGTIKLAEPGMHDVTVRVGGFIEKLYADQEGMHVIAGQPLFEMYSPDLQVAQQELLGAVKARKALMRNSAGDISKDADRMIESAKRKLELWGISDQDINAIIKSEQPLKTIPIRSPATGHVEEKSVVQGSAVAAMSKVMRVVDHRTIWLEAQVYQDDAFAVKVGQEMTASVEGLPGRSWSGKIEFIYPHLDHMARTIAVRTSLTNPDFLLRPGMYATAELKVPLATSAILVPREAVVDTGDRKYAFVAEAAGHYQPRIVHVGAAGDDDMLQIIDGVQPGEKVVTSGQFLLDVESRTTEAINKLRMPTSATATPAMMPMNKSSTTQTATALVIVHCPMKKADWIQRGNEIANPYFGSDMLECGDVTGQFPLPSNSPLANVVAQYLEVQKQLSADQFKLDSLQKLKSAAADLNDAKFLPLKQATADLAQSKDIEQARDRFATVSAKLIAAVGQVTP